MKAYKIIFGSKPPVEGSCIAVLGGGGKTSFMFQVGNELASQFEKVLLTSITKAGPEKEVPISLQDDMGDFDIELEFTKQNPVFLLREKIHKNKYRGISEMDLNEIRHSVDITVFEADGARNLPLKAHNNHDPIVPQFATHAVLLIGADAVDTHIRDGKVHRPELFCEKWQLTPNDVLSSEIIANVVTHPNGYLSKIKTQIPITYFVNKAGVYPKEAEYLAKAIMQSTDSPVFYGSINENWWAKEKL
ncbi:MAG: putative selenium-dependent hydroxylase accessory protein YqeC [Candidatus Marinimicrobia bacterium]|nr:putative selenium-dependent hydroxylase accessory protein YqeC [Candidatus Neomarinimicrobiota bacterium]